MTLHTGAAGSVINANDMDPEVERQLFQIALLERAGVLSTGDMAVTQNGGGSMSVVIAAGFATMLGTEGADVQGMYHAYNDGAVAVSIATSDLTNPRIDV